jgi:hypothetical protein
MVDTISAIDQSGGFLAGKEPAIIRYPSEMTLVVWVNKESPSKIFRPYLVITYKELKTSLIDDDPKVTSKFSVNFGYYDTNR